MERPILRILVLCRGNVTRSPFIAGYLNHLYRTSEMTSKFYLDMDSSGLEGKTNRPAHPIIVEKGLELGFDLAMYRSKHASYKDMKNMDLIFVVDSKQYRRFTYMYPQLLKKVYHIFDFGREENYNLLDIDDPSMFEEEEAFDEFFQIAIMETERIWEYVKQVYYQAENSGEKFHPKLFFKSINLYSKVKNKYNFFTKRFFPVCPKCQSKRIRRTKRSGLFQKKILPSFNAYPYHCGNCGKNVILFIGSEISSTSHRQQKRAKWQHFMEEELQSKRQQTTENKTTTE